MFKGVYIDDDQADLSLYGDLLNSFYAQAEENESIKFTPLEPASISWLYDLVQKEQPEIVALDYRLDGIARTDGQNKYRAGTIAQTVRELAVEAPHLDMPIVLISTEDNIKSLYGPDKTSHDLFDHKILKGDIAGGNPGTIPARLLDLCVAYDAIKRMGNDVAFIPNILGLAPDEWDDIQPARFSNALKEAGNLPHQVARFFKRQIIERAGLLVGANDVAALLGIAQAHAGDAFERLHSHEELAYKGILSSGWPRIWNHKLRDFLKEVFGKTSLDVSNEDRSTKINGVLGTEFAPAPSPWTGETNVRSSFACSSCGRPTELTNSIAAFDPWAPTFSQRQRICFDCVSTGLFEQRHLHVDQLDERIAEDIRDGKVERK
ncbi:hypothetical protein [Asticcacaulis sp. EMRT-3]|uniref:hypothetical protein n=1 Tax=Asticcacaulis sp. EMRT-3 TaxID=3040349 RepID=UPI0024AF3165|nr:hypothetical protein [Asticcacaulis sp. EMRT-3]MDI7774039.1 hypothetical protein [Asticcacaulis sp. EMRT-3]